MKGMENRYIVFLNETERERERERENSSSKTLFYKDFSLGSQRESLWPKQRLLVYNL